MTTDPSQTPIEDTPLPPAAEDAATEADAPAPADTTDSPPASDAGEPTEALSVDKPTAEASTVSESEPASDNAAPRRGKIRIGSRRPGAAEQVASAKPLLAGEAYQPVKPPAQQKEPEKGEAASDTTKTGGPPRKVPVPPIREPLPADLEQEINSAFGDEALDELVSSGPTEDVGELLEEDSRLRATVVKIHGDNVFFSLGGRNQGVASVRQF